VVNAQFEKNSLFHKALKEAFVEFVNKVCPSLSPSLSFSLGKEKLFSFLFFSCDSVFPLAPCMCEKNLLFHKAPKEAFPLPQGA